MDPVTMIGLISGILSFVSFSVGLVQGAKEIHNSVDGALDRNRSLEEVVKEMQNFTARLITPPQSQQVGGPQQSLCLLATTCHTLSTELLDLLQDIKARGSGRREAYKALVKSVLKRGKIEELEDRLKKCRSELNKHLNTIMSEVMTNSLERLEKLAKENNDNLRNLPQYLEELRKEVQATSLTQNSLEQLRRMLDDQEQALDILAQRRILSSLDYEGRTTRYDMVSNAHEHTFYWFFDDRPQAHDGSSTVISAVDEDSATKAEARARFTQWLSSEEGIFHISGKLGSGKSTLVKYLSGHEGTKAELKKWAGNRRLVFASFFFWRPGTAMQKSLPGLFRSLLYDVLDAYPSLISQVLTRCWKEARNTPWQVQTPIRITSDDISKGIEKLFVSEITATLVANHCFCFFIDGLDEYEETNMADYRDMVNLFRKWTAKCPKGIKLCISSREYNIFMDPLLLSPEKRLRIHLLTRDDMRAYSEERLDIVQDVKSRAKIVDAVVAKAEGIFQWVVMAVKEIRRESEADRTPDQLIAIVNKFPGELDSLYEYLLNSPTTDANRRTLYRLLKMVLFTMKYEVYNIKVRLGACYFFDDYEIDSEFAMKESFTQTARDPGKLSESAWKLVNMRCRGLVDRINVHIINVDKDFLHFTHRSLPEFLKEDRIKDKMLPFLWDFNPLDALSQLELARFLTNRQNRPVMKFSRGLVHVRQILGADKPPFKFLNFLAELSKANFDAFMNEREPGRLLIGADIRTYTQDMSTVIVVEPTLAQPQVDHNGPSAIYFANAFDPLYIVVHPKGNLRYAEWRLANDPSTTESKRRVELLCYSMLFGQYVCGACDPSVLVILLQQGHISARTMPVSKVSLRFSMNHLPDGLTIWQQYLAIQFFLNFIPSFRTFNRAEDHEGINQEHECFATVIEHFLQSDGVDTEFQACIFEISSRGTRLKFGKEQIEVTVEKGISESSIPQDLGPMKHEGETHHCWHLTLRTWIEHLKIPNTTKERLLSRLDSLDAVAQEQAAKIEDIDTTNTVEPQAQATTSWLDTTAHYRYYFLAAVVLLVAVLTSKSLLL